MPSDPHTAAGLVAREVHTTTREDLTTRTVVARRTYPTDPSDLWDAITNPERLPRWFLPISGELHEGGRYQLEGNAGGTVERCDEPRFFAVTWEFAEQVSWLRVTLTPTGEGSGDGSGEGTGPGTTLEIAHEAPADPDFWTQYGPGAAGVGWDLGLMGLGLHLDTGAAVDPAQAQAWPTTPDGVAFIRDAATSWADAAVADGDDPGDAHQAAERTIAFYTVPPDA